MEELKKPTTKQKVKVYEELLEDLVQCNESLNYMKMESLLRRAHYYFEQVKNPNSNEKKSIKEEVSRFNQLKRT